MGLFSRKQSSQPGRRTSSRSAPASEAQADDLRGRARRRLIGALALVVAAVIVVPLLIQTQPEHAPSTPIVVPAPVPPMPDPNQALATPSAESGATLHEAPPAIDGGEPVAELPVPDAATASAPDSGTPSQAAAAEPAPGPRTEPEPRPEPAPKPEPKPEANAQDKRTDDGSVALALLEGRPASSAAPAAANQGSFVLQAASYSTEADAVARRDGLVAAGITNAFVETASPGGKTTYRLRVGPFPTREAAQAALTRLRSLKYEDSFISSR